MIVNYLVSEQTKKQEALKIGIFTVFLVVMIISMLKSVVDSTPILFVKLGQEAAGAFDFQLSSPKESNAMLNGDVNYYAVNPFDNPFCKDCPNQRIDQAQAGIREQTGDARPLYKQEDSHAHEFPDGPPPELPEKPDFIG